MALIQMNSKAGPVINTVDLDEQSVGEVLPPPDLVKATQKVVAVEADGLVASPGEAASWHRHPSL